MADFVAMVKNGKSDDLFIFQNTVASRSPQDIRVTGDPETANVIAGLDEGLISMKVGGIRRLYIPGGYSSICLRCRCPFLIVMLTSAIFVVLVMRDADDHLAMVLPFAGPLAFPKGLASAPGRPRVAPNSDVVFDVYLRYIPGA